MNFTGRYFYFFLFCWLGLTVAVWAQKPKKLMKKGEKAYFNDNLPGAITFYEQAAAAQPNNPQIQFRLGELYLLTNQTTKSLNALQNAVKLSPKLNGEYIGSLARAYHLTGQFDSASVKYQLLLDKTPKNNETQINSLRKRLQETASGKSLMALRPQAMVLNPGAPLNSPTEDMVPVLVKGDSVMILVSDRAKAGTSKENEDIFETHRTATGWSELKPFGKPINTSEPDAVTYVMPDAKTFYVFLEKNGGDIAEIKETSLGIWSKPELLDDPINSPDFEPSFFITKDKQFAFFSSDRPEGFGGLDLYLTMRQPDGSWSEALNLGSNINTPYDEDAPFVTEDGNTLYFSSRGHNSMGGYDIFRSSSTGATWSPAENLGYPVNSPFEDIYFTQTAEGAIGYFTSDRTGGLGEKDIYEVNFRIEIATDSITAEPEPTVAFTEPEPSKVQAKVETEPKTVAVAETPKETAETPVPLKEADQKPVMTDVIVFGRVTDAVSKNPINAELSFKPLNALGGSGNLPASAAKGNFSRSITKGRTYEISIQAPGYLFVAEKLTIPGSFAADSVERNYTLRRIRTGANVVLENVFFEFNNHVLRAESLVRLEKLADFLKQNPGTEIEISGHTDSRGKPEYNQALSLRRANSVLKYLVDNGIEPGRLKAVGRGASQPVASNDTDAGRQQNRRTEFKILKQ